MRAESAGLVLPAGCQGFLQFGPVVAPASLDLGVGGAGTTAPRLLCAWL